MFLGVLGVFTFSLSAVEAKQLDVVCYVTSWSQYRPGSGKFAMQQTDVNLCDEVLYSFLMVGNDSRISYYESNDEQQIRELVALKGQKPSLKVKVAIGGWTAASRTFSKMVSSKESRKLFIDSSIDLMKKLNLDGLDLDWEYPGLREGSHSTDKDDFVKLVEEMGSELKAKGLSLSAAFGAGKETIDSAYDVSRLHPHLDHLGIMTYDFFVCADNILKVEHQAPLFPHPKTSNSLFSTDFGMKYYEEKGAPKDKLMLGLPLYGRLYGLDKSSAQFGDAYPNGNCPKGEFTREPGYMAYYEICAENKKSGMTVGFDEHMRVPYSTGNNKWIGYDDKKSLEEKIKYAKDHDYRGLIVWAIDLDDFNGQHCGQGNYPLMKEVYRLAKEDNEHPTTSTSTTHAPSSTTTHESTSSTTTTAAGGGNGGDVCKCGKRFVPNVANGCKTYFDCETSDKVEMDCPAGIIFDIERQICDWPNAVTCKGC